MTTSKMKLYNDLFYEIFTLLIDWIQNNNINYDIFSYRQLGYFPYYDKNDSDRIYANSLHLRWRLHWYLAYEKIEKRMAIQEDPFPLAILEDEKLSIIHTKIIAWCETHRLHPEFNKPTPQRKRCYRPTQYRKAWYWLWSKLRKNIRVWEKRTTYT